MTTKMLTRGVKLGPYEIVSALGEGGMGQVYRARDTRLDRTVALKVLSAKIEATPELLARFEREARAIAALQHPNICVLHDLGREGATSYLVMEYLEGETLAARLRRGALPLAEIVAIGAQIAAALDRAHRAGIVHRDLKPANVMLTKSGAKLLDFGLAKSGIASSLVPTAIEAATAVGAVLGTIPYMAPEQIEGREADVRSDIYALGCVLYEMATGEPAFKGTRAVEPPALNRLIQACLARNPDERLQSAHDAGLLLAGVGDVGPAIAAVQGRRWLWPAVTAAAVVVVAATVWVSKPAAVAPRIIADIPAPPGAQFRFQGSSPGPPVISPDGTKILFSAHGNGHTALFLRPLDSDHAVELPGTLGASLPFWSPDSRQIAFNRSSVLASGESNWAGGLMVMDLAGGRPRRVADTLTFRGGTWLPDGSILYAPNSSGAIFRVAVAGGAAQPVLTPNSAPYDSYRFPVILPDGRHFLYLAVSHSDPSQNRLFEASLDGKMNQPLVHSLTSGIYAQGQLLYSVDGTLTAQAFDPATAALSGAPRAVAQGVFDDSVSWRPGYSASRDGMLVYAQGSAGGQRLAWVDRTGKPGAALSGYQGEALDASVDRGRVAVSINFGTDDIWIFAPGGTSSRLTFGGAVFTTNPVWSPDGRQIAFTSRSAIFRRPADGGAEQRLGGMPAGATAIFPESWTADGREILCLARDGKDHTSISALDVQTGSFRPLATLPVLQIGELALSPDNRWAAYLAAEPGHAANVFLMPFRAGGGSVWQAPTPGATRFFWVNGGRELDFTDAQGRLLALPVSVQGNAPVFGAPVVVAEHFPAVLAATPDGQRFLTPTYPDDQQRIVVMTNWAGH